MSMHKNLKLKGAKHLPPIKSILCIDTAMKTGWAKIDREGNKTSGTKKFGESKVSGGGMKYHKFMLWIEEQTEDIDAVFFEEVRNHKGVDASHSYGFYAGYLMGLCEKKRIPYQGIPVGTIKKHATGKGNAGKEMVIKSVKKKGHNPEDDNEADALALLYYVIEEFRIG